jgi:hypothetical protein
MLKISRKESTGFTKARGRNKRISIHIQQSRFIDLGCQEPDEGERWLPENLYDRALTGNCFNVTVIMHFPSHSLSACNFNLICGGDLVHVSSLPWWPSPTK